MRVPHLVLGVVAALLPAGGAIAGLAGDAAPAQAPSAGEQLRYIGRDTATGRPALVNDRYIAELEHAIARYGKDEGEPVPPIMALEIARRGSIEKARTIYCGTFSKVLSPGLRIGWIVAPKPLIRRLVLIKQASDLNNATLNQMAMHRMAEAAFDERVAASCAHYRRRRDAMLAALANHMPKGVSWTEPKGGLFTWLRLPEGFDGAALLTRSLAEARVAFVPGSAFYFDDRMRNTARLSYSLPSEDRIEEGIMRLARLI